MSSPEATTGRWWSQLSSRNIALVALLTSLGALIVFFAFNSGGFFPGAPAFAAMAVCVVLVLRCVGGSPFEGVSVPAALMVGAFAAYTIWTLVSQAWSHAPALALESFNQTLVYLVVLVAFVSIGRSRWRVAWAARMVAIAIIGVCTCALITRVLPRVWPISLHFAVSRLSYPISYWNALGLFAALGIVLCLHISSERSEHAVARVVAAAAIPMLGVTLYFTLSRGGIAALILGGIVYLVVGRPRLWISTAIAAAPTTAIAAKVAYGAGRLTGDDPTSARAVLQGHHVATVLLECILAAALLRAVCIPTIDRAARRVHLGERVGRLFPWVWWAVVVIVALALAIGLHGRISHEFHQFTRSGGVSGTGNAQTRLTSVANDNRLPLWRVAWSQFQAKPLLGHGAGTYVNTWDRFGRASAGSVINAHNLYLENLDTLGIVGTALLMLVLVGLLLSVLSHARGPSRPLYGAIFAVMLMWAAHAAIDWDWQMPVLTIVFFGLGGMAVGREASEPAPAAAAAEAAQGPSRPAGLAPFRRALLGIGCCLLAVAPAYVWLSQRDLDAAADAFASRDCKTTTDAAISSIHILGTRPEAYEALAYCDVARQEPRLALVAMRKAQSLDRDSWRFAYGVAVVRAAGDRNPRAAARHAMSLYPQSAFLRERIDALLRATPANWSVVGQRLALEVTQL